MSVLVISVLAAILFYYLYAHLIQPIFFSPLSGLPRAHPTSPLSSLWIRSHRRQGRTGFRLIQSLHKKHGPIVLLSPNEISVASLDGLRKIYLGAFEKSDVFEVFANFGIHSLVSMRGTKEHGDRKRMISHVFSKSAVFAGADLRVTTEGILERLLVILKGETNGEEGSVIDMYKLNQALCVDFVSAFLFGKGHGTNFLTDEKARERWSQNWSKKLKESYKHEQATEEIESVVMDLCRKSCVLWSNIRNGKVTDSKTIVSNQLFNKLSELSAKESEIDVWREVASEMMDDLIAADITKITLTYLQWELSKRPQLQVDLRNELHAASLDGKVLDPKELDNLPLLDAVLKETLRLYPPTVLSLTRIVPPGGANIDGISIPAGMEIGTTAYAMHMNADVFPDPYSFMPERWVREGSEKLEMNRWFWAFGSGGRMCIGSHLALYMVKEITAAIYTHFETVIMDDGGPGEMEQEDSILAGPVGGKLWLRFQPLGKTTLA